jgi:hypothetical protein
MGYELVTYLTVTPSRVAIRMSPTTTTTMTGLVDRVHRFSEDAIRSTQSHPSQALETLFQGQGFEVDLEDTPADIVRLIRQIDQEFPVSRLVVGPTATQPSARDLAEMNTRRQQAIVERMGTKISGTNKTFARCILGVGPASREAVPRTQAPVSTKQTWTSPFDCSIPRTLSVVHGLVLTAGCVAHIISKLSPDECRNPWRQATLWDVCEWVSQVRKIHRHRTIINANGALVEAVQVLSRLVSLAGICLSMKDVAPDGTVVLVRSLCTSGIVESTSLPAADGDGHTYLITNNALQIFGAAIMDTIRDLRGVVMVQSVFKPPSVATRIPPPGRAFYSHFKATIDYICASAFPEEIRDNGMQFALSTITLPGDVEEFTQVFQEKPTVVLDSMPLLKDTVLRIVNRLYAGEVRAAIDVFVGQAPGSWLKAFMSMFTHHAQVPDTDTCPLFHAAETLTCEPLGLPKYTWSSPHGYTTSGTDFVAKLHKNTKPVARMGAGAGVGSGAGSRDVEPAGPDVQTASPSHNACATLPAMASAMALMAFCRHVTRETGIDITACFMAFPCLLGSAVGSVGPFNESATRPDGIVPPTVVHFGGHTYCVLFRGTICAITDKLSIVVYTWCTLVLKYLNGDIPVGETETVNISPFLKQTLGIHEPIPGPYVGALTSIASATRSTLGSSVGAFPTPPMNASMMWKMAPPAREHTPKRGLAIAGDADDEEVARVSFQNSAKAFIKGSAIVPDAVGSILAGVGGSDRVPLSILCPRVGTSKRAAMVKTVHCEKRDAPTNDAEVD